MIKNKKKEQRKEDIMKLLLGKELPLKKIYRTLALDRCNAYHLISNEMVKDDLVEVKRKKGCYKVGLKKKGYASLGINQEEYIKTMEKFNTKTKLNEVYDDHEDYEDEESYF